MKIAFIVCSNGYGHFHRILQVCAHFNHHEVDIYCEQYQYNRFKPKQSNLNFIFYKTSNIRWDNKEIGSLDIKNLDKYDKVITDNLVEVLKYRPDALLSGSFLWSDVWRDRFGDNNFSDKEDELFNSVKPKVICNGDVVFGQLQDYENKVDIGWGCKDDSTEDYNLDTIVCVPPSLNYTDDYTDKFYKIREAKKVEELGIGIRQNVYDDFILPPDVTKYRESFKKLKLNGYLKFAGLIND